jgi:Tfp pilus assembly protein PilF
MKYLRTLLPVIILICSARFSAEAQTTDAGDLIKEGIALHNQGKYAEALDKFNTVLKTDPEHAYANYEMAFSLYVSKKGKEAIPYLQKAVKSTNENISSGAYALLASIYDEANDTKNAIAMYREVIKINPNYPQVYYNFGLTYFRNQQYQAAEACAIEAITRNPQYAGSHRLYALVTFHQNKRMNALMGFSNFLLLEPTGARAAEAYGNMQHILQGGVLAESKRDTSMAISTVDEKEMGTFNIGIKLATSSAKAKNLAGADLLEYELKNIFNFAGELSQKKTDKSFFDKFYVDYFYKLAQSSNMAIFARMVAAAGNPQESAKWNKENADKIASLNEWAKSIDRQL